MTMDADTRRAIAKISREVVALKKANRRSSRTAQGAFRSIEGGAQRVFDDDGTLRQVAGLQGDGTYTLADVNGPPPPAPSAPTVEGRPGLLVVSSYGFPEGGSVWPADFRRIDVHVGGVAGFTPTAATKVSEFTVDGGSVALALDAGTYYVVLVAVNTSEAASVPSVEASATVTAPVIVGGVQTFHSDTAPTGLDAGDEGALWYDTNDDNHQYRWDGSLWVSLALGGGGMATLLNLAGKTITGPLIRTAAIGRRIQLDASDHRLEFYSGHADENTNAYLTADIVGGGIGADLDLVGPSAGNGLTPSLNMLSNGLHSTSSATLKAQRIILDTGTGTDTIGQRNGVVLNVGDAIQGFSKGRTAITTNSNGRDTIPHNLGVVPDSVSLTVENSMIYDAKVYGRTSASITVQIVNTTTGAAAPADVSPTIHWQVWA